MTQQPEALRLADELRAAPERSRTSFEAAAELRRLHAELERCKQVCAATAEGWRVERDALLEALKRVLDRFDPYAVPGYETNVAAEEKARAAIKAVEGDKT